MMKNQRGFTLIELLVVIAIVGVLAGAVLVAINPQRRIQEANDANLISRVGQVAEAVEACYTNNNASYANCDTIGELESGSYLKSGLITNISIDSNVAFSQVLVFGTLQAGITGCANTSYRVYTSSNGQTNNQCLALPPSI